MSGNFTEIDSIKKRRFLNAFAQYGGVVRAEEHSGVTRQSHYHWLKDDPEYAAAFKVAYEMAGDVLENEAIRRARDGVSKPVYQGKKLVGHIQEYSDTLLIFLLKGVKPEQYKERIQIDSSSYLRQLAQEHGLDPDEVIREAQAIVSGSKRSS